MSDDSTPRLGLPIYESGSALHPTRVDFNARMELIDSLAAIARQGDHEDRPMPGTRGLLWFSRDRRELFWDAGDEWEQVAPVGSSGSNTAIRVGSPDSTDEGESRRIARADHTHALPLATSDEPGAMSAVHKELLDTATSDTDNNAIVRRLPNGRIGSANPTAEQHLTNRAWVESLVEDATQDIEDATFNPEGGTLMRRAGTGTVRVTDPSNAEHAATKGYVDDQIDGITQSRNRITSGDLDDYTTSGVYSAWSSDFDQISNLPDTAGSIILEVTAGPSSFVRQDATNVFTSARFWRSRTGNTWRDWQQIATA